MNDEKSGIQEKVEEIKSNPKSGYILMGVVGAIIIGIAYYLKVVKKKQDGDFVEDEDEEDDDEEYESEDDESDKEDDFFSNEEQSHVITEEEDYPEPTEAEMDRPTPTAEDVAETIGDDE